MCLFAQLPYAAVANGCFAVHGGIPDPVPALTELEGLRMGMVSLARELQDESRPEVQLVWNDPAPEKVVRHLSKRGFFFNDPRGIGKYYGPPAADEFLSKNSLKGIIRGHGGTETAIQTDFGGTVITINETGPSSTLTPWVQGLLHVEDGRLRVEIFPTQEEDDENPEAPEYAHLAESRINKELSGQLSDNGC